MKIGDLVWTQVQGFNCGHHTGRDGMGTVISLEYSPQNKKSSDTVFVFIHRTGKVEEFWRLQVGLHEEREDECW